MGKPKRVTGLQRGGVMSDGTDVHFSLGKPNGETIDLVANTAAAEQITAALARMSGEASARRAGQIAARSAEAVALAEVQRDRVGTATILLLTTDRGIQFRFALTPESAADIAARLKTESERVPPTGRA